MQKVSNSASTQKGGLTSLASCRSPLIPVCLSFHLGSACPPLQGPISVPIIPRTGWPLWALAVSFTPPSLKLPGAKPLPESSALMAAQYHRVRLLAGSVDQQSVRTWRERRACQGVRPQCHNLGDQS